MVSKKKSWQSFTCMSIVPAGKYAEVTRGNQKPKEQATAPVTTDESAQGGKAKKEKKPAKPAAQPVEAEKPKAPAKKAQEAAEEEEEPDEVYADEPKQNDPFAEMPKPSLNMDEFKRVYSNEDTAEKAIPYFWKNYDNENCSIWFCEYKYPAELTKVFMTSNLIGGFFQRLDKLRKNAFGSMCVFGEDNNNTITGIWFWRGKELVFEVSDTLENLFSPFFPNSSFHRTGKSITNRTHGNACRSTTRTRNNWSINICCGRANTMERNSAKAKSSNEIEHERNKNHAV